MKSNVFAYLATFILVSAVSTQAQWREFTNGGGDSDWMNPNNWTNLAVPGLLSAGENANISNGNGAVFNSPDIAPNHNHTWIGDSYANYGGAGFGGAITGVGSLTINGGNFAQQSDIRVARGHGAQGTLAINGGAVRQNGGTFWIAGENNLHNGAGDDHSRTVGTLIQTGGSFIADNDNNINNGAVRAHWGQGNAPGGFLGALVDVQLTGGSMRVGELNIGQHDAHAHVQQTDHTLTVAGWFTLRGDDSDGQPTGTNSGPSHDTYTMNRSTLNIRENMHIGQLAGGGHGTFTATDSQINTDYANSGYQVRIGDQGGAVGSVELNNTDWRHGLAGAGNSHAYIGLSGGSRGWLTINSPNLNSGSTVSFKRMTIGNSGGSDGTVAVNGLTSTLEFQDGHVGNVGRGTLILNDGRVTHARSGGWFEIGANQNGNGGTIIQNGGTMRSNGWLMIGKRTQGWYHLNGGHISADRFTVGDDNGNSDGTFVMNGGSITVDRDAFITRNNSGSRGTLWLNAGTLDLNANFQVGHRGQGNLIMQAGTRVDVANTMIVGDGGASIGVVDQPAGSTVKVGNELRIGRGDSGADTGTYNFDGGLMMIGNRLRITDRGTLNWGNGVDTAEIRPIALTTGLEDFDSSIGGPNQRANYYDTTIGNTVAAGGSAFPEVRGGTRIELQINGNDVLTTSNSSLLNLGNLYQLSSITRYNQLRFEEGDGDIDLAGVGDTLQALTAGVEFLRAFGSSRYKSYGSLALVSGGGDNVFLNGNEFDNFTFTGNIQAREFTGTFTNAQSLPLDNWYLEYTNTDIIFHYHLNGQIPEPGTMGLLALGVLTVAGCRKGARRRKQIAEPSDHYPSEY